MRRSRSILLAASVLACGVGACSLLTSTAGLNGGGDPSAPNGDAAAGGIPTSDAAGPPGIREADGALSAADATASTDGGEAPTPADSSVTDSPLPTDAPAADAPAGDAGPPSPLFADDFEGPSPLPRAWDVENTLSGTLALDSLVYVSPHTALGATSLPVAASAPANGVNVSLRKRFPLPGPGLTARYELSVYFRQYDTVNGADCVVAALQTVDQAGDLAELQIDARLSAANTMQVIFAEYTGYVDGGSSYVSHATSADLKLGAWNRVVIELTQAKPPTARVLFDGVEVVAPFNVSTNVLGPTQQISAGLSYVRPGSGGWIIDYDDVLYDVRSSP